MLRVSRDVGKDDELEVEGQFLQFSFRALEFWGLRFDFRVYTF